MGTPSNRRKPIRGVNISNTNFNSSTARDTLVSAPYHFFTPASKAARGHLLGRLRYFFQEGAFSRLFFVYRLVGLGVWFSLWVQEVPGSNPRQAQNFAKIDASRCIGTNAHKQSQPSQQMPECLQQSRTCWTFTRWCEACFAVSCDCSLWKLKTQYTAKIFCSRKIARLKNCFTTTTFRKSIFITQCRMRYAIYIPPNTKYLTIGLTMATYGNRQNAIKFGQANNSDLLQALKILIETRL